MCVLLCILVRFLILDPHYTGKEDLKTIVSKVGVCFVHCEMQVVCTVQCRDGVGGNQLAFGTRR